MVGPWSEGILVEHYLFRDSYTGRWINTAALSGKWGEEEAPAGWQRLREILDAGLPVWLVGRQEPILEEELSEHSYQIRAFHDVRVARKEN